jgi:F0F1-type ATP synthase assembly protein I
MSEQRPAWAPGMVLAQVSLRVIVPLLAGVIAGLVADSIGQTAPRYVLIGLAAGTLVSVLWLRAFIASNVARMRRGGERAPGPGSEEHEHSTTERS